MLELLVLRVLPLSVVLFRCESGQSFFVDVYPEGVDSGNCDVDPEVELESVNEEGIVYVVADDERGVFLQFCFNDLKRRGDADPFTLRTIVGLGDVSMAVLAHLLDQ